VLHSFCSLKHCADGDTLIAPLTFDTQGNLYGTTAQGGTGHFRGAGGTVFKLTPSSQGWSESVLYSFCSIGSGEICPDGNGPYLAGVVFDASGSLYGTTGSGGSTKNPGAGVVYKLTPGVGKWKEQVLAADPVYNQSAGLSGGVALDPANNIFGTSLSLKGAVYRLNSITKQKKLFLFDGNDGGGPIAGVTLDLKHNVLYGTTAGAGEGGVEGIYKIDLTTWKETMLYQFCSQQNCTDGDTPWPTMIMDSSGNLYGTTEFGGEYNNGVVFEYTP
jgi:uncharacterized repeat protein (TIGR03803 family)